MFPGTKGIEYYFPFFCPNVCMTKYLFLISAHWYSTDVIKKLSLLLIWNINITYWKLCGILITFLITGKQKPTSFKISNQICRSVLSIGCIEVATFLYWMKVGLAQPTFTTLGCIPHLLLIHEPNSQTHTFKKSLV